MQSRNRLLLVRMLMFRNNVIPHPVFVFSARINVVSMHILPSVFFINEYIEDIHFLNKYAIYFIEHDQEMSESKITDNFTPPRGRDKEHRHLLDSKNTIIPFKHIVLFMGL